jgi:predicted lipoprotein with Yx(FWY)xxD motif
MQKKTMWILTGIVVVVIAAVGGYAIFHKSPKTTTTNTTPSSSTTTKPSSSSNKTTSSGDIVQTETESGTQFLADSNGNALYTYGGDTAGVSNCTGSCLTSWPVYAATSSTDTLPTNVTIITRSDGSKQYAYKGMPLYTFTGDSNGQATGNGIAGFSVAKP